MFTSALICGEQSDGRSVFFCSAGVWVTIGVVLILIVVAFLALAAILLRHQRRRKKKKSSSQSHAAFLKCATAGAAGATASGSEKLLLLETPRCISADSGYPTSSPTAASYQHTISNTSAQSTSSDRARLLQCDSDVRSPAHYRTLQPLPSRSRSRHSSANRQPQDEPIFTSTGFRAKTLLLGNPSAITNVHNGTRMCSSLISPARGPSAPASPSAYEYGPPQGTPAAFASGTANAMQSNVANAAAAAAAGAVYVNPLMVPYQSIPGPHRPISINTDQYNNQATSRLSHTRTLPPNSFRRTDTPLDGELEETNQNQPLHTFNAHHYARYRQPLSIDGSLGFSIGTLGVAPVSPRSSSTHSSQSESGSGSGTGSGTGTIRAGGQPAKQHHLSQLHIASNVPNITLHRSRSRSQRSLLDSASNTNVALAAAAGVQNPIAEAVPNSGLMQVHRRTHASASESEKHSVSNNYNAAHLQQSSGRSQPLPPPVPPHGAAIGQQHNARAGLVSASEFRSIDGSPPNRSFVHSAQPQHDPPATGNARRLTANGVEPDGVFRRD